MIGGMKSYRLKTGHRVLGAFAIVLVFVAAMTAVSMAALSSAEQRADELVQRRLLRQQLAATLQGEVRLNGALAVSIANSDSLELTDVFMRQQSASDHALAATQASLRQGVRAGEEAKLLRAIDASQGAYLRSRTSVFQLKDMGRTQEAASASDQHMLPAFRAYSGAASALLSWQTAQARTLAAAGADQYRRSRFFVLGLGLAACGAALVLAWRLTRSVVIPLRRAMQYAVLVARGDLSRSLPHRGEDEIGQVLRSLSDMARGLGHTVVRVRDGAVLVDGASREIAASNRDLSQRTVQQAAALDAAAESLAALGDSARANADHARTGTGLADTAADVAGRASSAVTDLLHAMDGIAATARRIEDITAAIDGIAFQTNILALNAAVEAARAGEHGRGFAVVAGEVRQLAQRAATSAREIKLLMHAAGEQARQGSSVAQSTGTTMDDVVGTVARIRELMGHIDRASAAQQSGLQQLGDGMRRLNEATRADRQLAQHAEAAAERMLVQAEELTGTVQSFRLPPSPERLAA
jgi:methyl-accepting chemotaxis protein